MNRFEDYSESVAIPDQPTSNFEQSFANPREVSLRAAELLWLDYEQSVTERSTAKRTGRPESGTHFVSFGDEKADSDSQSIEQLLESAKALEGDPAGKKKLRDMLAGNNGDDGALAARHILQLMVSNDPQQSKDGERMLKLMLDKEREPIALRLLSGLVVNPDHVHQFLELMENHADRSETRELTRLLQSSDSREHRAAMNLLSLSAQTDRGGTTVIRELVSLLKDDKKRDDALVILSELGDPRHLRPMLQLMGSSEQQAAARSLVDLLKTDNGSTAVRRLLERSTSNFGADRSETQAVLGMLNDRGQQELAVRALSLGLDPDRQRTLIDRLRTRTPAGGERFILDILESRDPQAKDAVIKLLDSLASNDSEERERGEKLIGLLADEKHQSAGLAVMKNLDDKRLQDALFEILAEPSLKEPAQRVLLMLAGDKRDRDMATNLVSMWAYEKNGSRPAAQQLLQMLPTIDKDTAQTILRHLDGVDANNVLSALNSETLKGGAAALLGMLSGQDYREQNMARSLLEMLRSGQERGASLNPDGPPSPPDPAAEQTVKDGQTLMSMLGDPQGKEVARTILSNLPKFHQRHTMLELLSDKEYRTEANQLLAWLTDPKMSATARGVLEQIKLPTDVAATVKTINKLSSPEDRAVLAQLAEGGGLRQLISLIHSPEPSQQKAGAAIFEMLKDPNQNWQARTLLKPDLTPESLTLLVTLSQSKDSSTASAADGLVTMVNTPTGSSGSSTGEADAARRILNMMQSKSAEQAKTGNQLFQLLAQPDGPALVAELAGPRSVDPRAALEILTDAQSKRAAETFRKMILSEANGDEVTWPLLTDLLSSREPVMQQFGRRIVEMLDDPQKQTRAQNILTAIRTSDALNAFAVFGKQSGVDTGKILTQMMVEGDSASIAGMGNIFRSLAFSDERVRAAAGQLIGMLSDPKQRDLGQMILSRVPDQLAWPSMLTILNDPVAKKAAIEVLSNGDRNIHRRLTEVLAVSTDPVRLFTLLANAETAPLTRQLLPYITAQNADVLASLISADSKHPALISLIETLNQPETRESVRVVLERVRNTEIALHLAGMLRNPASKPQAEALLPLLLDDDIGNVISAENILELLRSPQEKMHAAGEALLRGVMSNDSSQQQTALDFARVIKGEELVTAARLLSDKRWTHAVSRMQEIVSQPVDLFDRRVPDRRAVVGTLLRLLGSSDPAAAKEGERLLEMLNDPRYESAAVREARRRYAPPFRERK